MERPFLDKTNPPSGQRLQSVLADAFVFYTRACELAGAFSQDWAFSKSSGWMLKVYDRKKALYYLIPLDRGFKISLTLRENERGKFMQEDGLAELRDDLASARKFSEGFALQFDIADEESFRLFELLIRKLIAERG